MCLVGFRGGTRGLVLCKWFMLVWTADDGGQKRVDKGGEWKIKYSYRSGQGDGEERQTAAEDRRGGSPRRPELCPRSALEENR